MRNVSSAVILTFVMVSILFEIIFWVVTSSGTTKTMNALLPSLRLFCKEAVSVGEIVQYSQRYTYSPDTYDFKFVELIYEQLAVVKATHDSLLLIDFTDPEVKRVSVALSETLVRSCTEIRESINNRMSNRISTELMKLRIERAVSAVDKAKVEIVEKYEKPLQRIVKVEHRSRVASLGLLEMKTMRTFEENYSGLKYE